MDILEELKELIDKLNAEKIEYALCGGLAMAIYALPRATLDIDILIESSSLDITRRAVHDLGFTVEAAPMEFHDGKVHIHQVSKIEPNTGEILVLDLLIWKPLVKNRSSVNAEQRIDRTPTTPKKFDVHFEPYSEDRTISSFS